MYDRRGVEGFSSGPYFLLMQRTLQHHGLEKKRKKRVFP